MCGAAVHGLIQTIPSVWTAPGMGQALTGGSRVNAELPMIHQRLPYSSLHRERAGCHVIPEGRDKSKRECLSANAPVCGLFCVQEGGASSPGAALLVTYGATAR